MQASTSRDPVLEDCCFCFCFMSRARTHDAIKSALLVCVCGIAFIAVTILYYTILYYTTLYYTLLHYSMHAMLCYSMLARCCLCWLNRLLIQEHNGSDFRKRRPMVLCSPLLLLQDIACMCHFHCSNLFHYETSSQ